MVIPWPVIPLVLLMITHHALMLLLWIYGNEKLEWHNIPTTSPNSSEPLPAALSKTRLTSLTSSREHPSTRNGEKKDHPTSSSSSSSSPEVNNAQSTSREPSPEDNPPRHRKSQTRDLFAFKPATIVDPLGRRAFTQARAPVALSPTDFPPPPLEGGWGNPAARDALVSLT